MNENQEMFGLPEDEAERRRLLEEAHAAFDDAKWGKTLVEYVEVLEALYLRRGLPEDQAFRLAADSVLELAEQRGGRSEYLPRGDSLRTALRHAEIYRRARRGNIDALASEFGVTTIHAYRIIRQQGALHRAKIQGNLFPPSEVSNA